MDNYSPSQNKRLAFALLFTLAVTLCWFGATVHSSGLRGRARNSSGSSKRVAATAQPTESSFIRQYQLLTKDLVYNPSTHLIYASLPSASQLTGNSIVSVEPNAGTFGSPAFIGSEPNKLALSDDGHTLYAGLDGAAAVRRFDVTTQTAGLQFSLGADPYPFGPRLVNDMEVQPGNPNVVVVSRRSDSSSQGDVAVYENGVLRPGVSAAFSRSFLEFGSVADTIYANTTGFNGLLKFRVDSNGLTLLTTTNPSPSKADLEFDNGKLYSNDGKVIDADTGSLLGSFTWPDTPGTSIVRPDSTVGRVYFITKSFSSSGSTLRVFDQNTFTPIGTVDLPDLNETPTSLLRWGSNGLAFRTNTKIYLIQTSLIPSADPIPTPTPTPSPTPSPSASPAPSLFVREVSLPTKDLIVIPSSQAIYASVPSDAGVNGNSLAPIDPVTGNVGSFAYIGSEPSKLALSDDGHTIYAGLDGAGAVRRFDIATQTPGLQFSLGNISHSGALVAKDLEVQPGNPNVVVVARQIGPTSQEGDVAAYENGIQRQNTTAPRTRSSITFGSTSDTVHAKSGSGGGLLNLKLDATGLTLQSTSNVSFSDVDIVFDNGRLYSNDGKVIDAETGTLLGTFSWGLPGQSLVKPDSASGRVYFLTSDSSGSPLTLRAFDLNTFNQIGSVALPAVQGTPTSLVRWGSNGLAFRSDTKVYLIQTSLVPSADPVPTPTPTPSPTPSPSPSASLFVRQINILSKDLVVIPSSQMIYASIVSDAGSIGNSLTKIDPVTGSLGPSTFIGSEPGKLALSDDGHTIYASLDGASAVRRFDADNQTASTQFNVGNDGAWPYTLTDLAVMPGNPNAVAIAGASSNGTQPGVAVFDNGVRRPTVGPSFPNMRVIEFGTSPNSLYAYNNADSGQDFSKLAVSPAGVTLVNSIASLINGTDIKFSNGLLYTTSGNVLDPESQTLVGNFKFAVLVAPDPATGRIYVLAGGSGNPFVLKAIDIQTLVPLGSVQINGITTAPSSLVRWGANGLAFRDRDHIFLVQTSLVPSADPVPSPTPTPSPTPSPSPAPTPDDLKIVSLATNDLVFDANTQKFFATVPSSAGASGNSITPIDSASGTVGSAVPIGTEPGKLVISDDGQFLYTVLNQTSVRRFVISTQTPSLQINLGTHPNNGAYLPSDIAVLPGNAHAFAVARKFSSFFAPKHGGVAIFDDDVQRTYTTPAAESESDGIEFSNSSMVLYGYESTNSFTSYLRKMVVSSCGVSVHNIAAPVGYSFDSNFRYDNGLVYSNFSRVVDPESGFPTGSFSKTGRQVVADYKSGRAYVLDDFAWTIYAYDLQTYLQVGAVRIPGVSGTVSSLRRWGSNGLAFRTSSNQVVILRSASLIPNAPLPVVDPLPPPKFTISGRVTDSVTLVPVSGVTVTLSGAQNAATQTDANGSYSFTNLDHCSSYTVTPSKDPYGFSPASKTVIPAAQSSVNNGTQANDFSALAPGFQFSTTSYEVLENANTATITVMRAGDISGAASINYFTTDGTAKQRSDYTIATGTLSFAPGETTKSFVILIVNDTYQEPAETVQISLSDPVGSILGPTSTATLTIRDDDFSLVSNPLDVATFFVRQHYYDFLGRVPDQSGFNFWVAQITQCGSDQACLRTKRIDVSNAFYYELEYQQTGSYVYRLYRAAFGNNQPSPNPNADPQYPNEEKKQPSYAAFANDRARVKGGPNLAQSQVSLATIFVQRPEFIARYPASLDGPAFVDAMLGTMTNDIGVNLGTQRQALIDLFNSGGRAAVLYRLADDNAQGNPIDNRAFIDAEYNRAFVVTQYFGYLRRNPDVAGFIFWLGQVNGAPLRDVARQHSMVCSFITSIEYQQRFSPAVTHNNTECPQ